MLGFLWETVLRGNSVEIKAQALVVVLGTISIFLMHAFVFINDIFLQA